MLGLTATAAPPARDEAAAAQFFEAKVRPVLVDHCLKCHGPDKAKSNLRLDSRAGALAGGDQGPAVVPGKPAESLLVAAVGYEDDGLRMPPSKKLPATVAADLARWIEMGAPWPGPGGAGASPAAAPKAGGPLIVTDRDRAHWAFRPVRRPAVPGPTGGNPIDAFIRAGLEARGLKANPPADRTALIRRVTFDLTGLPPTPAEVDAFLADTTPDAYDRLVDRLLASPRFGEAWARHWLDLVRFAETNSYERDDPKPSAWRYRDYVVRAFNDDKPYDRFVREQLAGDELPDGGTDGLIATGYYRLGIWDDEPTDREQARYDGLDDVVATTGQVFLGLTVDCARCHDHKIDPVPQADYYRLLAFFQNINHYRNGGPTDEAPLVDGQTVHGQAPTSRQGEKPLKGPTVLRVTEAGRVAPDTFVLLRGNPQARGPKVGPGFLTVLGTPDPVIPTPAADAHSTGRRTVLADWIASESNPLTARVIANRLWQHHFGRGIVRSSSNFGTQGDAPTHPELLDWLASELAAGGWRLKPLHRLIVTSDAYRRSSRSDPASLARDPANDGLWRTDPRRLTAEELRDAVLAVSGELDLTMYGPGVFPEVPAEVLAGQSMPGKGWHTSPPREQMRRSIYVHVKRSLLLPILESFDLAETDRSSPVRFSTTQPTQALAMLNGAFVNGRAAALADRLRREAGSGPAAQVALAFRLATARTPTPAELDRGTALMAALQATDGLSPAAALKTFALLVLNLDEFVYLD